MTKNLQINPLRANDFYKQGHIRQFPKGTELVYSNFTPRKSRIPYAEKVVFFGLQYFIKQYLQYEWNEYFFNRDIEAICSEYEAKTTAALGPNNIGSEHIRKLHNLGYLPIKIKAVPEGSSVPFGCPVLTIVNTHHDFFWLTNFLETQLSYTLWQACTSATISKYVRKMLEEWCIKTNPEAIEFVQYQSHDFAARGMSSLESSCLSGAGHLLNFIGTDTIAAIEFLEQIYNADPLEETIGVSVAASEHAVMCMHTKDSEFKTFEKFITEIYPEGIVSIVSDTWNLWDVVGKYLPELKETILNRNGTLVIRPDSSPTNPQDILCGWTDGNTELERKGLIESLWDIFGGTVSSTGYKVLNEKISAIYGDAIQYDRAIEICDRLEKKGFASTNCVYGWGSFSYQYNTRDSLGFAMKATYGEVRVEGSHGSYLDKRNIWKDPITDLGEKKSHKGLLRVNPDFTVTQECSWEEEAGGLLETVFEDGKITKYQTLKEIRERVQNG